MLGMIEQLNLNTLDNYYHYYKKETISKVFLNILKK